MNIIILVIIALTVIFLITGVFMFKNRKREFIITHYESYIAVLQYNMDKAYEIIHKDQILIYSLEATTVPEKEIKKATIDFLNLVPKLLGPNLTKEMISLYGNEETFLFNLAEYFSTKYDNDEIRKSTISEMMEGDNTEEKQT